MSERRLILVDSVCKAMAEELTKDSGEGGWDVFDIRCFLDAHLGIFKTPREFDDPRAKPADYLALLVAEMEDYKRHARMLADAFQDLYNEAGNLPEVKAAYSSVDDIIRMHKGQR